MSPDRITRSRNFANAPAAAGSLLGLIASGALGCGGALPKTAHQTYAPSSPDVATSAAENRYRELDNALPRTRQQVLMDGGDADDQSHEESVAEAETVEVVATGRSTAGRAAPAVTPAGAAVTPGGPAAGPARAGQPATEDQPALRPQLIVEGWLTVEVASVPEAAAAIRAEVEAGGGTVVSEQLSGAAESWYGSMQLKLPPGRVDGFLGWLAKTGEVRDKRIQGTDVSRTLYDQKIALENLELTLNRLRALLERDGLQMQDVLAIEREMTRLRGEIERIKGEKRWLEHRVALATITVTLRRRAGAILGARAKLYPGPRAGALVLLTPDGRERVRPGVGVAVHTLPRLTLELDVFEGADGESASVLATVGGAAYSDFLGRGRNRFLNPYLGGRLGYGYLDGSAFVFGAGGGIELFKHKYGLVDVNAFVYGYARESFDVALVTAASAVFAF